MTDDIKKRLREWAKLEPGICTVVESNDDDPFAVFIIDTEDLIFSTIGHLAIELDALIIHAIKGELHRRGLQTNCYIQNHDESFACVIASDDVNPVIKAESNVEVIAWLDYYFERIDESE